MEPPSTTGNSVPWRLWHCLNYMIGGFFFLIGSILLYPVFNTFASFNFGVLSAWLYTIGSLCFSFADFTEWAHYEPKVLCGKDAKCCLFSSFSINFFISLIGSIIYTVGSACFLPQINNSTLGFKLFIVGSSFIMFSQTWKLLRTIHSGCKQKGVLKQIQKDASGFFVDLFAGLGGAMYFTGSFFFFDPAESSQKIGATIYSIGGLFFCFSGLFILKRYFLQNHSQQNSEGGQLLK